MPLVYKGIPLEGHYRADLIVEDAVVVEVKSVGALLPVHEAQTLTYMKLTKCPIGLVINFNEKTLKDGVRRLMQKELIVALQGKGSIAPNEENRLT